MKKLKTQVMVLMGACLLIGAGLVFSCGGSDEAKETLSTPPSAQTSLSVEAATYAVGIAVAASDMALDTFVFGSGLLAPPSPILKPLAREINWDSNLTCPRTFYVDIAPDGCNPELKPDQVGSCQSLEIFADYSDGCMEGLVEKSGSGKILLEALDAADLTDPLLWGLELSIEQTDFIEGDKPVKNGTMVIKMATSDSETEPAGLLSVKTGTAGYSEGDKNIKGNAELSFSANGTIGGAGDGTATEATFIIEADVTATEPGKTEELDLRYEIVSDMSGREGNTKQDILTVNISGTSSEWGAFDLAEAQAEIMAKDLLISPTCTGSVVGGTIGVRGTDENGVDFEVILTFDDDCDGKAQAKITVDGPGVSGTYEGPITLSNTSVSIDDTILGQLFEGFGDFFSEIETGLGQLGQ